MGAHIATLLTRSQIPTGTATAHTNTYYSLSELTKTAFPNVPVPVPSSLQCQRERGCRVHLLSVQRDNRRYGHNNPELHVRIRYVYRANAMGACMRTPDVRVYMCSYVYVYLNVCVCVYVVRIRARTTSLCGYWRLSVSSVAKVLVYMPVDK